jgi:orotate phosphoribosyltransferase
MELRNRLLELVRERSYRYSGTPAFRLTSGRMSSFYFNLKKTTYSPEGQYLIGNLFLEKINEMGLKPDAIGGLTMGADPIAAAVSYTSYLKNKPIEAFVIRKEPKEHGVRLQIEGNVSEGQNVIIVDDVVTTGGSTVKAIEIAREHGLNVLAAVVLLDRMEENGMDNIRATGVPAAAILDVTDFRAG